MEATNIPAFLTEDYMPPENELKARVDFIYEDDVSETVRISSGSTLARNGTIRLEALSESAKPWRLRWHRSFCPAIFRR